MPKSRHANLKQRARTETSSFRAFACNSQRRSTCQSTPSIIACLDIIMRAGIDSNGASLNHQRNPATHSWQLSAGMLVLHSGFQVSSQSCRLQEHGQCGCLRGSCRRSFSRAGMHRGRGSEYCQACHFSEQVSASSVKVILVMFVIFDEFSLVRMSWVKLASLLTFAEELSFAVAFPDPPEEFAVASSDEPTMLATEAPQMDSCRVHAQRVLKGQLQGPYRLVSITGDLDERLPTPKNLSTTRTSLRYWSKQAAALETQAQNDSPDTVPKVHPRYLDHALRSPCRLGPGAARLLHHHWQASSLHHRRPCDPHLWNGPLIHGAWINGTRSTGIPIGTEQRCFDSWQHVSALTKRGSPVERVWNCMDRGIERM